MNEKSGKKYGIVPCIVGLAALAAFIVECATIMHGTTQGIGITNTPSGASITVDKQSYGQTPVVVKLD